MEVWTRTTTPRLKIPCMYQRQPKHGRGRYFPLSIIHDNAPMVRVGLGFSIGPEWVVKFVCVAVERFMVMCHPESQKILHDSSLITPLRWRLPEISVGQIKVKPLKKQLRQSFTLMMLLKWITGVDEWVLLKEGSSELVNWAPNEIRFKCFFGLILKQTFIYCTSPM